MEQIQRRDLPDGWDETLPEFPPDVNGMATRDSSAQVLNAVAETVPGWSASPPTWPRPPRPGWSSTARATSSPAGFTPDRIVEVACDRGTAATGTVG